MSKRSFIACLAAALLFLTSCAGGSFGGDIEPVDIVPAPPDFRAAEWGMSRARVKESERPIEEIYADDFVMLFETEQLGEPLLVCYFFEDDRLTGGEFRVEMGIERLWSERVPEMIESYLRFREYLIGVYGQPKQDDYRVVLDPDPDYEADSDMHHLYYNRLEYLTEWENERSSMSLRLFYRDRDFKFIFEALEKP